MPLASVSTGIDLYYDVHGTGEPVVLIPGTGFASDVWQPYQVPGLAQEVQLIVYDPRGCGRSSQVHGIYTIDQLGCDVVGLLEHLGLASAHLVGHSMGGRVALSVALNFPGKVRSLILAASGSGPAARPGEESVSGLPFQFVVELAGKTFEEHVRHLLTETSTYFTDAYRKEHPEEVEAFFLRAWATHASWPAYLRQTIARHDWEATHRLGEVSVPTLVLVGGADQVGRNHVAQSQVLRTRIPDAAFHEMPGQSHGFFWQTPDETNAVVLAWVREHSG